MYLCFILYNYAMLVRHKSYVASQDLVIAYVQRGTMSMSVVHAAT